MMGHPMRSMTGFATKTATFVLLEDAKIHISINLKSVNARFFECTCKFPYALNHLETDIIKVLKQHLYRGHLFMSINVSDQSALKGKISVSMPIAKSYVQAIEQLQKETALGGSFTISDLIDLPHIFSVEEQALSDQLKEQLLALTEQTIAALIHEQEKEGAVLHADLMQRISYIETYMHEISLLHQTFMAQRKTEILNELQTYTTEDQVIESRKAALYYLLDKIDIHEEIIRFSSHLASLKELLNSPVIEKGKRLDFTLQELSREINTIAAKCSDATMGARAIDIKVELEKAREQTQNIL